MLVSCFGLKYKLIDIESLSIISPNFEQGYWEYMRPKRGDIFIDIGAHIGKYTMQAAKIVGNEGIVIAIEAEPTTFKALTEGVASNGFSNVVTLNLAVYDKECGVVLHSVPIGGKLMKGKGLTSIKRDVGPGIEVMAKPLDQIIDELKLTKVDFIKIDVEGAELEVLKGAKKTLLDFKPTLVVEISMAEPEILDLMGKLGYDATLIGPSYYCFKSVNRLQGENKFGA
jgi:FkbM family methyltransferase